MSHRHTAVEDSTTALYTFRFEVSRMPRLSQTLLSPIASFEQAERSNSLSLEDMEQVGDRLIASAEMQ